MKIYQLLADDMPSLYNYNSETDGLLGISNYTPEEFESIRISDVYTIGQTKDASSFIVFSKTEYPELQLLNSENFPGNHYICYPNYREDIILTYDLCDYVWEQMRKNNYPSMEIYLDAIVKNDELQLQYYKESCNMVKEKYPKLIK